jgi:hypothetical protein
MKNEGYLLLAVIIFIGVMLIVSGEDWHYSSDGDLRGTQVKYLENHSDISEAGEINITLALENHFEGCCS